MPESTSPGPTAATPARTLPPPARFAVFDGDLDESWLATYRQAASLAVDTEAMGLMHGRDRLCLVQICDGEDQVCCVRLARGQKEAPRLRELFEDPAVEKVFHFARFDVAALAENLGIAVQPVFCTKIASRLARTYAPRHGLKEVVNELVGVELDKQAQSSDWGRVEDLTEAQLTYACGDVRWLLPARERLEAMLRREERWTLAQQCFACIPVFATLDRQRFGTVFEH
ncbi:MAG: ribonuclease D [Cyanobacteriota bacterium]|nr:ribonuclease D [Cyanobacteriota bacterium]